MLAVCVFLNKFTLVPANQPSGKILAGQAHGITDTETCESSIQLTRLVFAGKSCRAAASSG